jgi:hypothetical protein
MWIICFDLGSCLCEGKARRYELAAQGWLALVEQADEAGQIRGAVPGDGGSSIPEGGDPKLRTDADDPEAERRRFASVRLDFSEGIIQAGEVVFPLIIIASAQGIGHDSTGLLGSRIGLAKQGEAQRGLFK